MLDDFNTHIGSTITLNILSKKKKSNKSSLHNSQQLIYSKTLENPYVKEVIVLFSLLTLEDIFASASGENEAFTSQQNVADDDACSFRFVHHYTWVTTSSMVWISIKSAESPWFLASIWKVSWLEVAADPSVVLFLLLCSKDLPIPFLVVEEEGIVLGTHKRVESWRLRARWRCCSVKGLDLKLGMLRLGVVVGDDRETKEVGGGGGNLVCNSHHIVKHILFQRGKKGVWRIIPKIIKYTVAVSMYENPPDGWFSLLQHFFFRISTTLKKNLNQIVPYFPLS